jgi:signal transduction histidine kinase/ActR/RegA family two-component response regulator
MRSSFQRHRDRVVVRYLIALAAVAVGAAIEFLLARVGGSPYLFLGFCWAVAVAAWLGGPSAGALAVLLSLLAVDFLFVGPTYSLRVERPSDVAALALFAAAGMSLSVLADRWHQRVRDATEQRVEAEQRAAQASRLEQATAALASAATPQQAIEASVQEALYALKADAGALWVVSEDAASAELVRFVGYPPDLVERWTRMPLHGRHLLADAVRSWSPLVLEHRAARLAEYGPSPEVSDDRYEATAVVALAAGGPAAAILRLDFDRPRTFTTDDRAYLIAIGPRAARALDRTRQYQSAQRARAEAESQRARADEELTERQRIEHALRASEARYRALAARTSRLHGLSAALSEAVTLHDVARAVVHHGKIVVGATAGEVALLVDEGGVFETLCGEDEGRKATQAGTRVGVEPGLCATAACQTRAGIFVSSFDEWQARYSRSASRAADGGYVSSAALPLLVKAAPIGVLEFHFTVPVNFDEEYQALLVSVAQHCAQALDRAGLYEAAQRARADAEAANRLKDEFVSIVSHELRTPLNSILGWTSMLSSGMLEQKLSARALQAIHENATRQAKIIDELLDFSRIVTGRVRLDLQSVDLRRLLDGVVESMLPMAAASGVELRVDPLPAVWVTADPGRLEQIFLNLLGNAVKFTPTGGHVRIAADNQGGAVEVRIADTGIGIDHDFLPHVFDRFRQADAANTRLRGGLGLGLSIARQLVEAHRGTILVESPGRGSGATFTVRLPLAVERADRPAPQPAAGIEVGEGATSVPRLDGVRVLVVDDEADAREVMACALTACGANVTVAGRAAEALDILAQGDVDVLLADIAMPEQDGYSLIRQVRAAGAWQVASIPAAAVTAHARDDERRRALDAGFQLHLAKPLEPNALARAVHSLYAHHPPTP